MHGEALENAVGDDYVTKEFLSNRLETMEGRIDAKINSLESRIDAKFDNFKAQFYQAMFLQGIAIVGLTAGLIKLMK